MILDHEEFVKLLSSNKDMDEEILEIKKRMDRIVREFTLRIGDLERRLMRLEGRKLWGDKEDVSDKGIQQD